MTASLRLNTAGFEKPKEASNSSTQIDLILGSGNRNGYSWPMPVQLVSDPGQDLFMNLSFPDGALTIDIDPYSNPTFLHDLNIVPWPVSSNSCKQIFAFEVLEHFGRQGDVKGFFETFREIHRILAPGGRLYGSSPHWTSRWAWGDPGHTRTIGIEQLCFIDRNNYAQIGSSPMSDYRRYLDFDLKIDELRIVGSGSDSATIFYSLRKEFETTWISTPAKLT